MILFYSFVLFVLFLTKIHCYLLAYLLWFHDQTYIGKVFRWATSADFDNKRNTQWRWKVFRDLTTFFAKYETFLSTPPILVSSSTKHITTNFSNYMIKWKKDIVMRGCIYDVIFPRKQMPVPSKQIKHKNKENWKLFKWRQ